MADRDGTGAGPPGRRRWWVLAVLCAVGAAFALGVVASEPLGEALRTAFEDEPAPAERPRPQPDRPDPRKAVPPAPGTPVPPPPGVDPEATETRFEDFASDPEWESERNVLRPPRCPPVRQDFGYRPSARAGGAPGEVGGTVYRSHQTAYYARPLDRPRTLDEPFSVEGKLNVERLSEKGSSGILFGLFNRGAHEWRTSESIVMRVFDSREEPGRASIAVEYGTREYRTDQLAVASDGGVEDPEGESVLAFDLGRPRRFRLDYDPAAAGGQGRVVLSVEGAPEPVSLDLLPGHRRDGAVLDRFGMLGQQHEVSGAMEAYFGDLRLDGAPVPAAAEPAWEGRGNDLAFRDCEVETFHNFGYGESSEAVGGLIWRTDPEDEDLSGWYADGDGVSLDLDRELYASGRVRLEWAGSDSGVYLGWFDEGSKAGDGGGSKHVPNDLAAMIIEGPSEVGWYARPAYGTDEEEEFGLADGEPGTPTVHPFLWHEFTIHYDPEAGENGELAVRLDGRESRLPVSEEAREAGATLKNFGIRSVDDGGHAMHPVFDDLTYTVDSDN